MASPTPTETPTCPGCGAAHVVVGLDSVLLEIRPTVRRHVCNQGRVTIIPDVDTDLPIKAQDFRPRLVDRS